MCRYNRILVLFLGLFLSLPLFAAKRIEQGNLVMEDIPPIPADVIERMRQYAEIRGASLRDWLPGNALLIGTRFGNTTQLHTVAAPLGMRRQITFYEEPVNGGDFPPAGEWNGFLFLKDIGGNEQNQIFFFDLAEGRARLLTDGDSRNTGGVWSNDGSRFVYASTREDGRNFDIWLGTPAGPETAKLLLQTEGWWLPLDWSPDDRHVLLVNYVSINEGYVHELDVETGAVREIRPTEETIGYSDAAYDKSGRFIYLVSDENSEFRKLRRLDRRAGGVEVLTEDVAWDVTGLDLSGDGRWLAYAVNEDGIERLYTRDLRNGRERVVEDVPVGTFGNFAFSPDSDQLAIAVTAADSPADIYVYDLRGKDLQRWTQSEVGGLNPETFVSPTLTHYPTFDAVGGEPREIPVFVYRPDNGAKKHPVVISIHGGPEGQYQPYFSSTFQYFLNELEVAVVAPNVRGSSGYGKSYLKLDNGFKREDSVRDIGALLDWIATQPDLDAERVIVYGGSYGGYMVLASMTHFSDRLLGGVDVVGISNFVTFLENTQEYRRDLRRAEYGDERDPKMHEFLQRISPNNNVKKIAKPLLVIQGANDPRVPLSESEQMVATLRDNGGEVWYLMAKDEGHGFRKKENREVYLATMSMFIEHLLNESR